MTRERALKLGNAEAMAKAITASNARYQQMCRDDYSGDWSGWRMYKYMVWRRFEARSTR